MDNVKGSGDPVRPLGLYARLARRRPLPWKRFPSLSRDKEEPLFPTFMGRGKTLDDFLTSPGLDVYPAVFIVHGFKEVEELLQGDIPISIQVPQDHYARDDSLGVGGKLARSKVVV